MKLNTLLLLTLCGILHAKIMVLDDFSELRQLESAASPGKPAPGPKLGKKFPEIGKDVPPVGYQSDGGLLWSVICETDEHGQVPGKMISTGSAWYTFGNNYRKCTKNVVKVLKGLLYESFMKNIPACKSYVDPLDNKEYYPAIVLSRHGFVPGKATLEPREAWYTRNQNVFIATSNFFYLC